MSAGGVLRCRCPCLAAWSASLWLLWFAVVPCFPVSCSLVLCCRVVLCCCALLFFLRCCWCLLCPPVACCAVLCCAVGWLCSLLPGSGVCVLGCSFLPCRHAQKHCLLPCVTPRPSPCPWFTSLKNLVLPLAALLLILGVVFVGVVLFDVS